MQFSILLLNLGTNIYWSRQVHGLAAAPVLQKKLCFFGVVTVSVMYQILDLLALDFDLDDLAGDVEDEFL